MIVLDSIDTNFPLIDFKPNDLISASQKTIKEHIFKKFVEFNVPMENRLGEILIVGKNSKDTKNEFINSSHTYTTDEENSNFNSGFDLIEFYIPGIEIRNDTISFRRNNGGAALIILNNIEIEASVLNSISPSSMLELKQLMMLVRLNMDQELQMGLYYFLLKMGK